MLANKQVEFKNGVVVPKADSITSEQIGANAIEAKQIGLFKQIAEPTLPNNEDVAIWEDTDAAVPTAWLLYKTSGGVQVKVTLT